MDKLSVVDMDRETIARIREVAERLTCRIDAIVDPATRDRYEDACASLVLICRETRDEG